MQDGAEALGKYLHRVTLSHLGTTSLMLLEAQLHSGTIIGGGMGLGEGNHIAMVQLQQSRCSHSQCRIPLCFSDLDQLVWKIENDAANFQKYRSYNGIVEF